MGTRVSLHSWRSIALLLIAFVGAVGAFGSPADRVEFFGDVRLRWEQDFDSVDPGGSHRQDRNRIRARLRVGARAQLSESIDGTIRLRTGDRRSQQSPHITLWQDHGDRGRRTDVNFAKPATGALVTPTRGSRNGPYPDTWHRMTGSASARPPRPVPATSAATSSAQDTPSPTASMSSPATSQSNPSPHAKTGSVFVLI